MLEPDQRLYYELISLRQDSSLKEIGEKEERNNRKNVKKKIVILFRSLTLQ